MVAKRNYFQQFYISSSIHSIAKLFSFRQSTLLDEASRTSIQCNIYDTAETSIFSTMLICGGVTVSDFWILFFVENDAASMKLFSIRKDNYETGSHVEHV